MQLMSVSAGGSHSPHESLSSQPRSAVPEKIYLTVVGMLWLIQKLQGFFCFSLFICLFVCCCCFKMTFCSLAQESNKIFQTSKASHQYAQNRNMSTASEVEIFTRIRNLCKKKNGPYQELSYFGAEKKLCPQNPKTSRLNWNV